MRGIGQSDEGFPDKCLSTIVVTTLQQQCPHQMHRGGVVGIVLKSCPIFQFRTFQQSGSMILRTTIQEV